MITKLHSSGPHQPLRPRLTQALRESVHVQAAVAFVTKAGVDLVQDAVPNTVPMRLVASVRWPTDLDALSTLAQRRPNSIWLHLAGADPEEVSADKYQMHSKALLLKYDGPAFRAFVGSHNLTSAALDGINLEATIEVETQSEQGFVADLQSHLDACFEESEPFDPAKLDLYKLIQSRLHKGPPPPPPGPGPFGPHSAVVIHAEDPEGLFERETLQMYVGPKGPLASEFSHLRRVDLYLYPAGTLLHEGEPTARPTLFEGSITMVNTTADAKVEDRPVNCALFDLAAPVLVSVSEFPGSDATDRQVAIRLERGDASAAFVYHSDSQGRPVVRQFVTFEEAPIPGLPPPSRLVLGYLNKPLVKNGRLQKSVPIGSTSEVSVSVPSPDLYRADVADMLNFFPLTDGRVGDELPFAIPDSGVRYRLKDRRTPASRFVYGVSYRTRVRYDME